MTRSEHLAWCKQRAIEYCDAGDKDSALASMLSDMGKHEETKDHVALPLMVMMAAGGHLRSTYEMRRFIEEFN